MKLLWSSVICGIFLLILWILASKVWDIHVQFEETEMENGKVAINQAVNLAIDRCLSTVRTSESGKLECKYDYGDLDYISLTFNVTIQKVAVGISRSVPFSNSLQCHNPKGECHTIILFLVGWWFGSRHSILFCIVLFVVILFVCLFMYPVVIAFTSSILELSNRRSVKEYADKKIDMSNVNYRKTENEWEDESKSNSILNSEELELERLRKLRRMEEKANGLSSLSRRYVNPIL